MLKEVNVGDKVFIDLPISELTGFGIELFDALAIISNPLTVRLVEKHVFGVLVLVKSSKRHFTMWVDPQVLRKIHDNQKIL
jgi:hypothetical protein